MPSKALCQRLGLVPISKRTAFTVDMRYVGQSYTLSVPMDENASNWDGVRKAFAQRHTETFGHADENNDAEIVNIRLVSLGIVDKPTLGVYQWRWR